MMSKVVTPFIEYNRKKAELREKYRQELARELEPYLSAFGEAVIEEQNSGKSIDDIEDLIGVRNRNLIYAAKRAARLKGTGTTPKAPEAQDAPSEGRVEVAEPYGAGEFHVYIDNANKGSVVPDADGFFDLPEEWALDTKNSALYREAIAEIRRRLKE